MNAPGTRLMNGYAVLESAIGKGFAAALRDGLSKAGPTTRGRRAPAGVPCPAQDTAGASAARGEMPAGLTRPEAEDTLRRFTALLAAALADPEASPPQTQSALAGYARGVLSDAAAEYLAVPADELAEEAWLSTTDLVDASTWLIECAVGQVLEQGGRDAAERALLVTRSLGRAIRERVTTAHRGGGVCDSWIPGPVDETGFRESSPV